MQDKQTMGQLFRASRVIARSIENFNLDETKPKNILSSWHTEAEFLAYQRLSFASGTLLVRERSVPIYTFAGRNSGLLFNANECNVYDVSKNDANTNSSTKSKLRQDKKEYFLDYNAQLDELSDYILQKDPQEMNEISFDSNLKALLGIFVVENPQHPENYTLSLMQANITAKYLTQTFCIPEEQLKVVLYDMDNGYLKNAPPKEDILRWSEHYSYYGNNKEGFRVLLNPQIPI